MDSIKLAARCYNKGLISEDGFKDVLRVREHLIKQAIARSIASRWTGKARKAAKGSDGPGFISKLKESLLGGGSARIGKDKGGKDVVSQMGWEHVVGNLVRHLGVGAALTGGAAGTLGLISHHKDKKLKKRIEESYGKMVKEYPKLQEMDSGKVSRHFGVLARYAPSLAADPLVAGSWVQSTAQMGYIDTDAIKRLSDTQTAIDRAHEGRSLIQPGQFGKGMALAATAMT
jgi:hypothetical protein